MGVENNECVLATTYDEKVVFGIKLWVQSLDAQSRSLFAFVPTIVNRKTTIILAPDGSKKGWDTADKIATLRDEFIEILKADDSVSWVEVGYGEFGQTILRGNCVNRFNDKPYA